MTRGDVARVLGVVVGLALWGTVAGVVWEWVWTPVHGVAVDHAWSPGTATGLQGEFDGTGWYVVVAVLAGLVGGLVAALVAPRPPLLTLLVVVAGSALAAWLMLAVGTALGPADPAPLAKRAADGTPLPSALTVSGCSPFAAFPIGALIGLVVVFLGRVPRHPRTGPDEH